MSKWKQLRFALVEAIASELLCVFTLLGLQNLRQFQPPSPLRGVLALSTDRLLLGSDYRLLRAKRVKEQAWDALGEEAAQSVLHGNAQRLLGL